MASCDTVATADKSIDWTELRALHVKGVSLADLSKKFGVSYSAIRSKSSRERWRDTVAKAGNMIAQSATDQLTACATKHVLKMAGITDLAIERVASELGTTPSIKVLSELASIAETFDRIARRTYQLDKVETAKPATLTVNLAIDARQRSGTNGRILEAESVVVSDASDLPPAKQLS